MLLKAFYLAIDEAKLSLINDQFQPNNFISWIIYKYTLTTLNTMDKDLHFDLYVNKLAHPSRFMRVTKRILESMSFNAEKK